MSCNNLTNIEVRSGVNSKGEGFCTVIINGGDLLGQLSPKEVRAMALQWLEAAEAAETDSIVFRLLKNANLNEAEIASFVSAMRNERS